MPSAISRSIDSLMFCVKPYQEDQPMGYERQRATVVSRSQAPGGCSMRGAGNALAPSYRYPQPIIETCYSAWPD
jgi:hypothetical protein